MEAVFFFFRKSQFFSVAFLSPWFRDAWKVSSANFLKHSLRMCLLLCVFSSFFFKSLLHFVRRSIMDSLPLIIMIFESELGTKTLMICTQTDLNFLDFHSFKCGVTKEVQHHIDLAFGGCPTYLPTAIFRLTSLVMWLLKANIFLRTAKSCHQKNPIISYVSVT